MKFNLSQKNKNKNICTMYVCIIFIIDYANRGLLKNIMDNNIVLNVSYKI